MSMKVGYPMYRGFSRPTQLPLNVKDMPPGAASTSAMRQMPPPQQPPATQLGPAPSALEFRIHEMNRRLYIFSSTGISENDHQQWWDAFSHEFFDDDCKLWFITHDDSPAMKEERFCVGRNTVPRFFRSIFQSGIKELIYVLRGASRESQSPSGLPSYENENVLQVTKFDLPVHTEVTTECKLYVEFTAYDEVLNHRIRSWTLEIKSSEEYVYQENYPRMESTERRRTSKLGFFNHTHSILTMAKILEPMQVIMSFAKGGYNTDTRDLMRRTIFFHYERSEAATAQKRHMNAPQMMIPAAEPEKPKPARKRQRKPAANSKAKKNAAANAVAVAAAATNPSPAPSNPAFQQNAMNQNFNPLTYQDVMVVTEPTMMGGDYGEDDQREISRVENPQYDPNSIQMHQLGQGPPQGQPMGINGPQQHNNGAPSTMGPPSQLGGPMTNQMGQSMPISQMNSQMSSQMNNQMNSQMPNQMANSMHMPNSIPNSMPGGMNNQMTNPMQHQNPNNMPISMPNAMPNSMNNGGMNNPMSTMSNNSVPTGMQSQMPNPMTSSMPPGYSFQPQQQWPQPPNSAMITG